MVGRVRRGIISDDDRCARARMFRDGRYEATRAGCTQVDSVEVDALSKRRVRIGGDVAIPRAEPTK